jgi:RNA polymerase sigma-70 factor (ECF subfamily)
MTMEITDQQLLQNWCTRRDAHSFQLIVQRHAAMVFHTALRILKNRADAEDTTQACFESLVTAKEPSRIQSLGAWLHGMVTKRSLNVIRTNQRRDARESQYAREVESNEPNRDWLEIYPLIDEAIQSLDDQYRIPIVAHFLEGRSQTAIAEESDVTRSAVTKRIQKGVAQIESMLKEKGVAPGIGLVSAMTSQFAKAQSIPASLKTSLGKLALGQGQGAAAATAAGKSIGMGTFAKVAIAMILVAAGITVAIWLKPDPMIVPGSIQIVPDSFPAAVVESESSPRFIGEFGASATTLSSVDPARPVTDAATGAASITDAAFLSGHVFDGSNATVPGARVEVSWYDGSDVTKTDEEGRFEFSIPKNNVEDGDFVLLRQLEYQGEVYEVAYRGQVNHDELGGYLDSRLGLVPVTGVRVGEGEGIAGIWSTHLVYDQKEFRGELVLTTSSDGAVKGEWDDGAGPLAIKYMEVPETIELSAALKNLKAFPSTHQFSADGRSDIRLNLVATASVAGHVIDSDGNALPGWRVYLNQAKGEEGAATASGEDGEFVLADIKPDDYTVSAQHSSDMKRAYGSGVLTVGAGEELSGIEVIYDLGLLFSGLVMSSAGEPVEGATVGGHPVLRRDDPSAKVTSFDSKTGIDGGFELDGIPNLADVRLRLQVYHRDYIQHDLFNVKVDGSEYEIILHAKPIIEGKVVDAMTGLPIEQFRILNWARGASREEFVMERIIRRALINAPDGIFSIKGDGFNQMGVGVSAPGYMAGVHYLDSVQPGQIVKDIVIRLQPAQPIKGRVTDSNGAPLRGVRIYPTLPMAVTGDSVDLFPLEKGVAQTDSDGRFEITQYHESLSVVGAHKPGYAMGWKKLTSHTAPIELVLTAGTKIEGRITYDGQVVQRYNPHVNISVDTMPFGMDYADSDGVYEMENVPEGLLNLSARITKNGKWISLQRAIHVKPGETIQQNFDFQSSFDSYIEGTLTVDGRTDSIASLLATVHLESGDEMTYQVETGPDGSYQLGPIPAATLELGAAWILRADGSYLEPEKEWVTTLPGETTRHDINVTD